VHFQRLQLPAAFVGNNPLDIGKPVPGEVDADAGFDLFDADLVLVTFEIGFTRPEQPAMTTGPLLSFAGLFRWYRMTSQTAIRATAITATAMIGVMERRGGLSSDVNSVIFQSSGFWNGKSMPHAEDDFSYEFAKAPTITRLRKATDIFLTMG